MKLKLLISFVLLSSIAFAQEPVTGSSETFNSKTLPRIILKELNRFRISKGLDTLELYSLLELASSNSAKSMAKKESEKIEHASTEKNLKKVGATIKGRELTMKAVISKGREDFTNDYIAKVVYNRWEFNPKDLPVLINPKYTLIGLKAEVDEKGGKVYVSAMLGGYDITNEGLPHKKELEVPYNTKAKKLKAPDSRTCKSCESWRNSSLLQKGAVVSEGRILLRYPNTRDLRRIMKRPKDGLAVDVVQRSQYDNADYNIVDNNMLNKGLMTKVIYKEKFFKKNRLITKDKKHNRKVKGIEVDMGPFNEKITGPYELNVVVVQNGKVCKAITRGYTEDLNVASNTPIGLLPFDNTTGLKPAFEPHSESSILNFTIPFEKNKHEFKQQDIQPFIVALNEPDFIIDGVYVYAYSSIEGDSLANAKLQRKRAESVVSVLQSFQNNKIKPTIQTKDSWDMFVKENESGKYADLTKLGKKKAIAKINHDKHLLKELEPVLAKGRFAQLVMDVTYDISGNKEVKFSTVSFNKAVKAGKMNQAYKIMEYIEKRVNEDKYPLSTFDSLKIEENEENIGLLNNQVYYRYLNTNEVEEEDADNFKKWLKIKPDNSVLLYNSIFCSIKLDSTVGNVAHQSEMQQKINALYGKLDSSYVNGLNIEWQFKLMEAFDTLSNAEVLIDACIERIKSFYKVKEGSWQNALKLALVFNRARDYRYAANFVEPYLDKKDVSKDLVFLYISSASHLQEKYYSRTFARALNKAQELDKERYCKLFGEPFMTFQVLENPEVKATYRKTCK